MPADSQAPGEEIQLAVQVDRGGLKSQIPAQVPGPMLPPRGINLPPSLDTINTSLSSQASEASSQQYQTESMSDGTLSFAEQGRHLSGYSANWDHLAQHAGSHKIDTQRKLDLFGDPGRVTLQSPQEQGIAQSASVMNSKHDDGFAAVARVEDTRQLPTGQLRASNTNTLGTHPGQAQAELYKSAIDADARQVETSAKVTALVLAQTLAPANQTSARSEFPTGLYSPATGMGAVHLTNRNTIEAALPNQTQAVSPSVNVAAPNGTVGLLVEESGQSLGERLVDTRPSLVSDTAKEPLNLQLKSGRENASYVNLPESLKQSVADVQSLHREHQGASTARVTRPEIDPAMESLPGQQRPSLAPTPPINTQAAPLNPMMAAWVNREAAADNKAHGEFSLPLPGSGLKTEPGSAEKVTASHSSAGTALSATAMNKALGENVSNQLMRAVSRQALTNGRFTLQLNPRELGAVDIEFSTERGELQLAVVVRETATRELVENNLARLRQNLQEAGVNLGELDVRQEQQQRRQSNTAEPSSQVTSQSSLEQELGGQVTKPHTGSSDRLFDIYV